MARGQSLLTGFKARKSSGKWTDDDHSQLVGDLERWSQTIPVAGVGFGVRRTTDGAAVAGAATGYTTWDTVDWDAEGWFRNGLSSTITVPPGYGGWYAMVAWSAVNFAAAGAVYPFIQVTRSGTVFSIARTLATNNTPDFIVSTLYPLYPADQLRVGFLNGTAGNANTIGVNVVDPVTPKGPFLRIARVALLPKKINS